MSLNSREECCQSIRLTDNVRRMPLRMNFFVDILPMLLAVQIAMVSMSLYAIDIRAQELLPDTVRQIKPSIVGVGTVQLTRRPPGNFVGTGFIVGNGRYVLTNAHTLPKAIDDQRKEFLAVLTPGDKERVRKAEVVDIDREHDLSVLKLTSGVPLPPLKLGGSDQVREGQLYAFTGFPIGMVLGMRPVTHRGIVSAITPIAIPQVSVRALSPNLIKRLNAPYDVFQLDATAYPGNSGSPLYDPQSGAVIGVLNMVFVKESKENVLEKPSGISYAIPIKHAKNLLKKAGIQFE